MNRSEQQPKRIFRTDPLTFDWRLFSPHLSIKKKTKNKKTTECVERMPCDMNIKNFKELPQRNNKTRDWRRRKNHTKQKNSISWAT